MRSNATESTRDAAALTIKDLHVYYGSAHVIQGVGLELPRGILSIVGRNGMGKSTLCNAIMGLLPVRTGSIAVHGYQISGKTSHIIARRGVSYVPQGRRLWASLTVDEHLQLVARRANQEGSWGAERIYHTFPHLAERRKSKSSQLSGGEQQMLAIARALSLDPLLLVMDEPTEGLAPPIVHQIEGIIHDLIAHGAMSILIVEQNIGVATRVSENIAVMINGRIEHLVSSAKLISNRKLQQELLGVTR